MKRADRNDMTDIETAIADWEPLNLEWHQGFAFMDGVLLGDGQVPDVYIMLNPQGAPPGELAQCASAGHYPPSPLLAGQPVWRHRRNPWVLRGALRDYYLLPAYRERHGYHALLALPFRFDNGLESLGHQYWRDATGAYWFGEYAITQIHEARPDRLALLASSPATVTSASALFCDGAHLFLQGHIIASATARVRYCNHSSYQIGRAHV